MGTEVYFSWYPLDRAASWAGYRLASFALFGRRVAGGGCPALNRSQRIHEQLLVVALAFAAVYSLSVLIPPVRQEAGSFRKLLGHFGFAGEAA